MPSRANIFRASAIAILLLIGAEVFGCEMFCPSGCEISGAASGDSCSRTLGGDGCLCCCTHLAVSPRIEVAPATGAALVDSAMRCEPRVSDPPDIYHPPRG